jgi:ubiquitin-protein ligase
MAEKRISRELAALEKARADGKPWACGLAVTCDFNDPQALRLLCTYTCPQHYVLRGVQRRSPYAGYVIRFQIRFPADYPYKPMILQAERTFDFFHPLVACSGSWEHETSKKIPMGSSSAVVHGIYFLERELWTPAYTLLDVLEEGLQPMWTEGDCWVAASAKTAETCIACSRNFLDDPRTIDRFGLERLLEKFPQALPSFGGDMLPFMIVRNEKAEAARLKRKQKIMDDAEKQLQTDAVVCPADETSFEIIVAMSEEDSDNDVRIQVFPSLPVRQLRTAISQATGEPAHRIQMLMLGSSSGEALRNQGTLRDSGVLGPCRVWNKIVQHGLCHPFAFNGYNPVAANLLLTDVQKFEHLARQSWSAQRLPHAAQLICRSSFFISRSSLSPCVPLTRAPLPLASLSLNIPNPHQLHVISGWAIAAVRALACGSPYLLLVQRRVLGWAGVHRLAGHNPLAAAPPGTREHSSWVAKSNGYSQQDIPHSA